jgi:hypothetical protein
MFSSRFHPHVPIWPCGMMKNVPLTHLRHETHGQYDSAISSVGSGGGSRIMQDDPATPSLLHVPRKVLVDDVLLERRR